MTKEELKQEAEEYYYDRLDPNAIDSISEIADADTEDFIVSAYLASAEPREKRIAELEKENAELKAHSVKWHDLRKNPDDLPKENTLVFSDKGMVVMWRDFSWLEYSPNYDNIKLRNWEKPIAWCELPKFKEADA